MSYTPNRYSDVKSSAAATNLGRLVSLILTAKIHTVLGGVLAKLPEGGVHHERFCPAAGCPFPALEAFERLVN